MKKPTTLNQKSFIATLVILLPIAITFWISYSNNKEYAIKNSFKELKFISEASENVVSLFLEMTKQRAEDFASDGFIRDQLKRIDLGDNSGINTLNNHLLRNKKPLDNTILGIIVISLEGKIVASTATSIIGQEVSTTPFFYKGKQTSFVTETHHGFIDAHELIISTPVTDKATGDLIGVLANFISLSELSRTLSGGHAMKLGAIDSETREVYLVNKEKFMISDSRFISDAVMKQRSNTEPVTACNQSNHEIMKFYKDYRGVEVAGVSRCIPTMGWTLLTEQDADEILASMKEMKNDVILTMIIVTSLIGMLFSLLNQAIVKPIKKLSLATNAISIGNYDIRVESKSDDEVGQLTKAFNDMAREVKAKTEAFRDSEKKLAEAQRIGNIGSWEWNLINDKISWHFDIYRILGVDLPRFGATFDSLLEYIHADDRGLVKDAVNKAIARNENFSIDHRIILPDGSEKIVHQEAKVLFNESGKATSMIGMVQDVTKRKHAEDKLKRSSEQLHNLAMHLQDVRENERKRIARDIHDELGQILSVFNLELMGVKNSLNFDQKPLGDNIEKVMKMADNAIDSVQRISSELRPTLLDDLGLIAGIEWHTHDFERLTGIKCNIAIEKKELTLDEKLSTALFRIFQEALTNVLRHAGATRLDISMIMANGQLVLEIEDNGRGISDKEILDPKSFGLLGMRERLYPWKGKLSLVGKRGGGTKVLVSVPLNEKGEE